MRVRRVPYSKLQEYMINGGSEELRLRHIDLFKKKYKLVASFAYAHNAVSYLFAYLDPTLKVSGLKPDEIAVRFYSETMVRANDKSFIVAVLNIVKGQIYFLTDRAKQDDSINERSDYETAATKLAFLNVDETI